MGRPAIPRLPVQPLLDRLGTNRISTAAKLVGEIDPRNFYRYCRGDGFPVHYADKLAVRIGCTPQEIWGADLYDAIDWNRVDLDTVRYLETENMTAHQLEVAVTQVARLNDWDVVILDERGGYPRLVLARHGRIIHAFLKDARGRMSRGERTWRDHLGDADAECYVWRPADLENIVVLLGPTATPKETWTSSTNPLPDAAYASAVCTLDGSPS